MPYGGLVPPAIAPEVPKGSALPLPMNPIERTIRRLERRAFLAILVAELLRWLALLAFAAGTAVLLGREVWKVEADRSAWLFLPVAAALPVAVLRARARRLSRAGAAAWQDVRGGASGLLLTGLEVPDPRWQVEIEKAAERSTRALPRVRMGGETYAVGAALVFALLSWWIHVPRTTAGPPLGLITAAVERLAEKLATLDEEVKLDEELATDLAERLERLRERIEEATPESAFEAIDRLEERIQAEAERVREELEAAHDDLAAGLLDAARDPAAARESLRRAMEKLSALGFDEELAAELEALAARFEAGNLQLPPGLEFDPALLAKLSGRLGELLAGKLGSLADAGLLKNAKLFDPAALKRLADLRFTEHECDESCDKEGGT